MPISSPEGIPQILLEERRPAVGSWQATATGATRSSTTAAGGLLVPPRDPAALAAAIRQLLDEPGYRAMLSGKARRDAVARFDLATVNDQWVGLYRWCLAQAQRLAGRAVSPRTSGGGARRRGAVVSRALSGLMGRGSPGLAWATITSLAAVAKYTSL